MTAHTFVPHSTQSPGRDDAGRSGLVRAIAVVGLMLAVLGLATAPFGFSKFIGSSNSTNLELRGSDAPWMLATAAAGTGLSILLLIASAACLRLVPWGRRLMIAYAGLAVVLGAACGFLYARWLGYLGPVPAGRPVVHGGVVGFIELMGWVLGIVYGAWTLYVMTRPNTREAFRHGPPAA